MSNILRFPGLLQYSDDIDLHTRFTCGYRNSWVHVVTIVTVDVEYLTISRISDSSRNETLLTDIIRFFAGSLSSSSSSSSPLSYGMLSSMEVCDWLDLTEPCCCRPRMFEGGTLWSSCSSSSKSVVYNKQIKVLKVLRNAKLGLYWTQN